MKAKRMTILLGFLVMASMVLGACGGGAVVTVETDGGVTVVTATPEVYDPVTLELGHRASDRRSCPRDRYHIS